MPRVSGVFLLRSINAADAVVEYATRSYKFTGGAVVTSAAGGNVTVDVSGASANAWDIFGNAGAGLVLGTTSADAWNFISGGVSRGGFTALGDAFLKTHAAYAGSENVSKTAGVTTTDATPTTLFTIPLTDLYTYLIKVKVVARYSVGSERAAFERSVRANREGAGAVLSGNVHTLFTDKTLAGYDVQFVVSGNNILVQVTGIAAQTHYWSGTLEYQGVSTNV